MMTKEIKNKFSACMPILMKINAPGNLAETAVIETAAVAITVRQCG